MKKFAHLFALTCSIFNIQTPLSIFIGFVLKVWRKRHLSQMKFVKIARRTHCSTHQNFLEGHVI